jgi:hypothetical protein
MGSGFLSAKQVLLSHSPGEGEPEKRKGTAHEFQDYAYRLAASLNDLANLNIYMRLTKSYPRYILDMVYESIADSHEENKGRLFMWKFKQIRQSLQSKRDMSNFDYEHVIKLMKKFRNRFSESIIKKHNDTENNPIFKFITSQEDLASLRPKSLLVVGNTSPLLFSLFSDCNAAFYGIDYARDLTNALKGVLKNRKKTYFITKDFLKNSYKGSQFNLVIINQIWPIIPFEKEGEMLNELKRVSAPDSRVVITIHTSDEDTQEWKLMSESKDSNYYFLKKNSEKSFENKLKAYGIGIFAKESYNSVVVYSLQT